MPYPEQESKNMDIQRFMKIDKLDGEQVMEFLAGRTPSSNEARSKAPAESQDGAKG